ncbi:MAG TPA: hypothetical protein PKY33_02590 [Limnohabitans sp.]|jgi:hypothetical protein|uniref:hypothetical protein n=1 Tax=Limnohabitans sp. TaxID=1907725 RepID=UPI0026D2C112|nr:hypothetical protein [Limnohabitans sp.]HQR85612.1 hypothetical protein [Limnohabitans sp.]HQS26470.1 hypothetical protein [Limnohabitans sp.]
MKYKFCFITIFSLFSTLLFSANISAQPIVRLQCEGVKKISDLFKTGGKTEASLVTFTIKENGLFTIDGYTLSGPFLENGFLGPYHFMVSDEQYRYSHTYSNVLDDPFKQGGKVQANWQTTIKINRYTGQAEISEFVLNQGSNPTSMIVNAEYRCILQQSRKFSEI